MAYYLESIVRQRDRIDIGSLFSGDIEINLDTWRIKTGYRRIRRCCIMRCYAYNDIEKRTTGVFVNTTYFVSVHIEDGKKKKER